MIKPAVISITACLVLLDPSTGQTTKAPDDLIGHWPLDENADSMVGGWGGELRGTAMVGQADALIGTGCYGNDTGNGSLLTNLQAPSYDADRSLAFWFRTNPATGASDLFCGWGISSDRYTPNRRHDFGLDGGQLRIELGEATATVAVPQAVNDGQWHHVVLTSPGSTLGDYKMYIDGRLAGGPTSGANSDYWGRPKLIIGSGYDTGEDGQRDFNGRLDDFGVFDSQLPPADVAVIHGLGRIAALSLEELRLARILAGSSNGAIARLGDHEWVRVNDLPGGTGDYGGTLVAGNGWVALDDTGGGIRQWEDSVPTDPNPFSIAGAPETVRVRSGETSTASFRVSNDAPASATWQLKVLDADGKAPGLEEAVDSCLRRGPSLIGILPNALPFAGGVTGTQIDRDPANYYSPFQGGNMLSTDLGGPLPYSDATVRSSAMLGPGGRYFTLKHPSLFLFGADTAGASWFDVSGTVQSPNGNPETTMFDFDHAGRKWRAFGVMRPGNAGVNQLFLVDDPAARLVRKHPWWDSRMDLRIAFSGPGRRKLYYACFVSDHAGVGAEDLENLAAGMTGILSTAPEGVSVTPTQGVLAAGNQTTVTLDVNAFGLLPGSYPLALDVQPDGAGAEPVRAAVTLEVDEPALQIAPSEVAYSGVTGGPVGAFALDTNSAAGTGLEWSARLIGAGPWVSLVEANGRTPQPVRLSFDPSRAPGTGMLQALLEVTSGTARYEIPISYAVDDLKIGGIVGDPLRPIAYAMNVGEHAGGLLVLDADSGDILSVLRVGLNPGDVAFSPDGSELYVSSSRELVISRIDLASLRVTGNVQVPGPKNRQWTSLQVGRDGLVYHAASHNSSASYLRLVDFESGELLDTLEYPDLPFVGVGGGGSSLSDMFLDPTKERLYFIRNGWFGSSPPSIEVVNVSERQLVYESRHEARVGWFLGVDESRILADLDGERFYIDRVAFEREDMAGGDEIYPETARALSAYGELVATRSGIYDPNNGDLLAALPFESPHVIFTYDQSAVLLWNETADRFVRWALPAAIKPTPVAVHPTPPDGGAIRLGESTLRWSALPMVDGYRVYFGSSRDEVAAAVPGSPTDMGVIATPVFTPDPAPSSGTHYWRIDALRGGVPTPGAVFSFSVASFRVVPEELVHLAPRGARVQEAILQPVNGDHAPVSWSAASNTPWIELPQSSGSADTPLVLRLDPGGLSAGDHLGLVEVMHSGLTIEVPVTLRLVEMELDLLRADPNRDLVYGMQAGSSAEQPGVIASIDPASGDFLRGWWLSAAAGDFSVHPIEDRLYVSLPTEKKIHVLDLASWEELPALEFPEVSRLGSVIAGAAGRILVQKNPRPYSLSESIDLLDSESGEPLAGVPFEVISANPMFYTSDSTGRYLYRSFNTGQVRRVDLAGDDPVLLETGFSRHGEPQLIALSADGRRLLSGKFVLSSELEHISSTPVSCQAINSDGQLVASASTLYWADSGAPIASLPGDFRHVVFSSDSRYLVALDRTTDEVVTIPVASLVDLPGPWPRPGQRLTTPPTRLAWTPVRGATGYRVYLGSRESEVAGAGTSSALLIGQPTLAELELPVTLDTGLRYFWRVDAIVSGGVRRGQVLVFDVPHTDSGNPILPPPDPGWAGNQGFAWQFAVQAGQLVANSDPSTSGPEVAVFGFDPETGGHELQQLVKPEGNYQEVAGFATTVALDQGSLLIGDEGNRSYPSDIPGRVHLFSPFRDTTWDPAGSLAEPENSTFTGFAGQLRTDAGQLLVSYAKNWEPASGIHSFSRWPDWRQGAELKPSPSTTGDHFGHSIDIDGTRALIGAPGTAGNRRGNAYVFEFNTGTGSWTQRAVLLPSGGTGSDMAGNAVALAGDIAAISSGTSRVTPRVHLFRRQSRSGWTQFATLTDPLPPEDPWIDSSFGGSLLIDGEQLYVISASASWGGQQSGVIHRYRINGSNLDPLAPIVPPPGYYRLNGQIRVSDGWLFVGQGTTAGGLTDRILCHRIDSQPNHAPRFVGDPPTQIVSGLATDLQIVAEDPDDGAALVYASPNLPPGLSLADEGNGIARITGTPTDPPGTERWIRIGVSDEHGRSAVQTALVTVLSSNDGPTLAGIPNEISLELGEDLTIRPVIGGVGPLDWEWRRNGMILEDSGSPDLILAEIDEEAAGTYTLTVSNAVGSAISHGIVVTVSDADRFAGNWATFGNGARHSGFHPATLGRHRFAAAWQRQVFPADVGVHRAAMADGRVFAVNSGGAVEEAVALDLSTGSRLWSIAFNAAHSLNPPTWHDGRLYVTRVNRWDDSELWCLDDATGNVVWSSPHGGQWGVNEAPTVTDDGIWMSAGGNGGFYGFDPDGTRRFAIELAHFERWTPTLADGRVFTWAGGGFAEHDPSSGAMKWRISGGSYSPGTRTGSVSASGGGRVVIAAPGGLKCIDPSTREFIWSAEGGFSGSPAVSRGQVFGISGDRIRSFALDTGAELASYDTGAGIALTSGQPLLLNDHLIVASAEYTHVFHRHTAELLQTLARGGKLAYSEGYLVIAGNDGALHAFFANAAPEFSATMPTNLDAGDTADDLALPLALSAYDPDPDEPLTWAIVSVTRPEIFRTLDLDPDTGDLTVVYNPWQSGSSDVTISITDSAGNVTENTITFTVPEHPEPQLDLTANLVLNRQTGLYEHTITVTNSGAREVAGFDLTITGLPEGVCVNNASDCEGTTHAVHHRQPLAAGASVTLVLEYYAPARGTVLDPEVSVTLVTEPDTDPAAPEGGLAVDRCLRQTDGSLLIEFTATPGTLYEIHYSDDNLSWKLSPVRVRAAGNRVQWIDRGPPRTDSPPDQEPCRFYRVREIASP